MRKAILLAFVAALLLFGCKGGSKFVKHVNFDGETVSVTHQW